MREPMSTARRGRQSLQNAVFVPAATTPTRVPDPSSFVFESLDCSRRRASADGTRSADARRARVQPGRDVGPERPGGGGMALWIRVHSPCIPLARTCKIARTAQRANGQSTSVRHRANSRLFYFVAGNYNHHHSYSTILSEAKIHASGLLLGRGCLPRSKHKRR